MKLTQGVVGKLTTDGKADRIEWDDGLPGFGFRVREGGSRNYVIQYKIGQKTRRVTLGSAKTLTLEEARKRAKKELGRVANGEDPQAEKAKARATATETFGAIAERFLTRMASRRVPSYVKATRHYLMGTRELPNCRGLHPLKIESVTRREIASVLETIATTSGPTSADRARAALSSMFVWAMKEGITESNPSFATNTHSTKPARDRVLTAKELAKIWGALPDSDYGQIIKLLVYTGARKSEIGSLLWSEVHDRQIKIPGERTKNNRPFDLPLSDPAHRLLASIQADDRDRVFGRGDGGFGGWSKSKAKLNAKLDLEPWCVHDIRRTVATGMAECGVQPHIVEACLNHVSGSKSGVAGIYNRAVYAKEKREAFEIWANNVAVVLAQASGANVHQLHTTP
jgi:integrase